MNHGEKAYSKCKSCDSPIFFIAMKNGKFMPVDEKLFVAKEDDPSIRLILSDGNIQRGVKRGDAGHTVHFDTCTALK